MAEKIKNLKELKERINELREDDSVALWNAYDVYNEIESYINELIQSRKKRIKKLRKEHIDGKIWYGRKEENLDFIGEDE